MRSILLGSKALGEIALEKDMVIETTEHGFIYVETYFNNLLDYTYTYAVEFGVYREYIV